MKGDTKMTSRKKRLDLPVVPYQKAMESMSRVALQKALHPWLIHNLTEHDYGIDALVEVTIPHEDGRNFRATGKKFSVQLKATNVQWNDSDFASVRVEASQVSYWLGAIEPVCLALHCQKSDVLYLRWIDQQVVDELTRKDPAWIGQETVTIRMGPDCRISERLLSAVSAYVMAYKRRARVNLTPGSYSRLRDDLLSAASKLEALAEIDGFESVKRRLSALSGAIRTSSYVVAITGPARAGKSTLLNALVRKEISPVGSFPTTAVSLLVVPGKEDRLEIQFIDGRRISENVASDVLAEYATQAHNPDNQKGVRGIVIHLVNEILERGITYVDAPGLYDPSEEMRLITERALEHADAVLYVLDVSPAKHGGFSLAKHHIDDLQRLKNVASRLIVVLNKADVLSKSNKKDVVEYLENTLRKYDVWESMPCRPVFVSAHAAWKWHLSAEKHKSPLQELDSLVWSHLLETNSTGVDRLASTVVELQRASGDFISLIDARQMDAETSEKMGSAIRECRKISQDLVSRCRVRREEDNQYIRQALDELNRAILSGLYRRLSDIPKNQGLPKAREIEAAIQHEALRAFEAAWGDFGARLRLFATYVGEKIERLLQQARPSNVKTSDVRFVVPQVQPFSLPEDSFGEAWGGMFLAGLIGLGFGAPWALMLAAGGWLSGLFLSSDRRRKREIIRICEHSESYLARISADLLEQMSERMYSYHDGLERSVRDRVEVYLADVERQIGRLGRPISKKDLSAIRERRASVVDLMEKMSFVSAELCPSVNMYSPNM